MEKKFDLREPVDRRELASFLPTIDGRTLQLPQSEFLEALGALAAFLENPNWLTYQWGAVGPLVYGRAQLPLGLPETVQLGLELRELASRDNFAALLAGFRNPSQFLDTVLEVHTASFFSRLRTTHGLVFSPERQVRGRTKRPDLEVANEIGRFLVECKRPRSHVQRAITSFNRIAKAFQHQLNASAWPREARLELEIHAPLREEPSSLSKRIVQSALGVWAWGGGAVGEGPIHGFVLPRSAPFKIADAKFFQDSIVLDSHEATGVLNPKVTAMRIVDNGLDQRFARSTGTTIAEALRQLPAAQEGMIVLGDVPRRIAESAIGRRLSDPAYAHVLAFIVSEADSGQFHFTCRSEQRERLQRLCAAGLRPLFIGDPVSDTQIRVEFSAH
jgi:hypothetical protein